MPLKLKLPAHKVKEYRIQIKTNNEGVATLYIEDRDKPNQPYEAEGLTHYAVLMQEIDWFIRNTLTGD